jgi:hypothetical protein
MSPSSEPREPGKNLHDRNSDSVQTLLLYRIGRSSAWMAFFSLVLATAAGAAGWLFWNQLGVMQDQLDTLQDLSDKVQKTFDSSRAQSDALMNIVQTMTARANANADRPWVGVDSVSVSPLRPYEKLSVTAMVRNTGRSPALNVVVVLNTSKAAGSGTPGAEVKECSGCPESVLLPNSALTLDASSNDPALGPGTINRLTSGDETIVLNGRIDYKDLAGQGHRTFVCLTYRPKTSGFSACPSGNYFD